MLRAMMRQAFGVKSYSMYDDPTDIGMKPEVGRHVGHEPLGMSFRDFYFRELGSPRLTLIKTHEKPSDSSLAIYIVRDGRSAIVSWYNMLRRAKNRTDISMTDIILGQKVPFGDWSSHIKAWNPRHNPRVLLLRYQDLVSHPAPALELISDFIGKRQIAPWRDNFGKLNQLYPQFFAGGSDERNIGQLANGEKELFWRVHGQTMREFEFAA